MKALDYFSRTCNISLGTDGGILGVWDGPPPLSFFEKQIKLAHKMRTDERKLGYAIPLFMPLLVFVPKGLQKNYTPMKN